MRLNNHCSKLEKFNAKKKNPRQIQYTNNLDKNKQGIFFSEFELNLKKKLKEEYANHFCLYRQ